MAHKMKVLYVYGDKLLHGGMENYMMNYFRHIDRNRIQIDFLVQSEDGDAGVYTSEILEAGSRIHILPKYRKNPKLYKTLLREIFESGEYKIVHSHCDAMNYRILKIAKQCNIPVRIAHSHNTRHLVSSKVKTVYYEFCRIMQNRYATNRWACSKKAGDWLFAGYPYEVIPNAINVDKFAFHEDMRKKLRCEYGFSEDAIVLGLIGRFEEQKNQMFLLDVLDSLRKDARYHLLLIGFGSLKDCLITKANELSLSDRVLVLDSVDNPYDYYNMMDLFVMPSIFEGFPIVLIEAQANGLKCLVSDQVTYEGELIPSTQFLKLENEFWVDAIKETNRERYKGSADLVKNAGFDIYRSAELMTNKYLNLIKESV